jgi:hypothetical protein
VSAPPRFAWMPAILAWVQSVVFGGDSAFAKMAPDTIRTCDLCLRSNLTCPAPKTARVSNASLSYSNHLEIWNSPSQPISCDASPFPSRCLRGAYAGDALQAGETAWLRRHRTLSESFSSLFLAVSVRNGSMERKSNVALKLPNLLSSVSVLPTLPKRGPRTTSSRMMNCPDSAFACSPRANAAI